MRLQACSKTGREGGISPLREIGGTLSSVVKYACI